MGSGSTQIVSLGFVLRFVFFLAACISVLQSTAAGSSCSFPALFAFGTSLTDTGSGVLSSPIFRAAVQSPYGETYFGRPAGRFSDGRVLLDFLAQSIGLPFTKPYLSYKTAGTDFSQGINYAVAAATVQNVGFLLVNGDVTFLTVDSLNVQLGWHLAVQQAAQSPELAASSYPGVTLPPPNAFANGLYFFEFGGNDYGTYLLSKYLVRPGQRGMDIDNSYALSNVVPRVSQGLMSAIEQLYAVGARNFFLLNIYPEGCDSLYLKTLNGTKDANGCLSEFNEVDIVNNQQLTAAAEGLRSKYPDINVIVADGYSPYLAAIQNPSQFGFSETLNACCGAGPGVPYQFALTKLCNSANYVCPDPSTYVLWDGIHPTDAMNRYLINSLLSGQYLNPSNGLACATNV